VSTHFGDHVHGDKVGGHKFTGPVFGGEVRDAQFAWANRDVEQRSGPADLAPLVEAVDRILAHLDRLGLAPEDARVAREAGAEVLDEARSPEPDPTALRRALTLLKGALAPVALGASTAANEGARQWTAAALEQLGRLFV
jgi:hypothetical protein